MTDWTPAAIVRLRLSIPPTQRELAARNPGRLYPPAYISLTEMAARVGVSRRSILRWEAGADRPSKPHRAALRHQERNLRRRVTPSGGKA